MILSEPAQKHLQRLMLTGMDSGLARLNQISGSFWQVSKVSLRQGQAEGLRLPPAAGPRPSCRIQARLRTT